MTIIVTATPSLNQLNGRWSKLNWKKKYAKQLRGYKYETGQVTTIKIRRFGKRILDIDNYIGGCKPLIDAIKEEGIIKDDSPKYCNISFLSQEIDLKNPRTEIITF